MPPEHHPDPLGNIVFAHDNIFLRSADGERFSTRGSWPWHRYLAFGHSVTVVSRGAILPAGGDTSALQSVSHPDVSFEALPSLSNPVARVARRADVFRAIRKVMTRSDALVARLPSEIGGVAIKVAERLGKPWAVELVTCTWDALWNYGTWQGKAYAPISWLQTRSLVRRAPYVFYVTDRFLQRRYPSRGRTIGCSDVDIPVLGEEVLERRLRRVDEPGRPFVIGLIGYVGVKFKGVHTAIEALARIRDRIPPFELRILGAGDPAEMQALAEERGLGPQTRFCGTLPAGEPIFRWLDDADLYIQPSFQEGLPRSLAEALSRGLPALGSTAGGIPELLEPECLHDPGDAVRLAAMIEAAVTHDEWRRRQAERNFRMIQSRFTYPVLERKRVAFWDDFARYARERREA